MINVSQWRASIGLWYCHRIPYATKSHSESSLFKELLWSGGGSGNEGGGNMTFSLVLIFLLLLILSGDVELNPGPKTELTSSNALRLLVKCGFVVKDKWTELTSLLGVSLEERRRLKTMASTDQDYHFALEEGLQWWITNSTAPSWEELVAAIEKCADKDIAVAMKRELDIKDEDKPSPSELFRTHSADLSGLIIPTLTGIATVLNAKRLIPYETYNDILTTKGESDLVKSSKLINVLQRQLQVHKDPNQYLVDICNVLKNQQHQRLKEIAVFILQQLGESSSHIIDNPSPSELFRTHSADLNAIIIPTLTSTTRALCSKGLILYETRNDILRTKGESDLIKSSKLINVLQRQLQAHKDPHKYLVDICLVLRKQRNQRLKEIVTFILQQLSAPSLYTSFLDPDIQRYCGIIIDQYKHQPIVPTDWPPHVGEDFFGRLVLLHRLDRYPTSQTALQKAWYMLRGEVDRITQITNNEITLDIQDILEPSSYSWKSLRVVVDGPPGIGKTTLCRKLLNMWANGELIHGSYDLALYCPLRNERVAQANELQEILKHTYDCNEITMVTKWLQDEHGQRLLIVFDGWDELSTDLRRSSLAARIIRREMLSKCSVIVTSRSYASPSLIKLDSFTRHFEILGFSEKDIKTVIKGTLEKEPYLAGKLIKDFQVRGDLQSLCYIPLVCSIVILVYQKDGQLPTTLTELYENFLLHAIRRHVELTTTYDIEPDEIGSLHHLPSNIAAAFQEMCHFSYISLKEENFPKMMFSLPQLQQCLDRSLKEGFLGLMTTLTLCGERSYQFLHLSIQEFLAAWWIAKYEKSEEVFAEHFDNDHFRMCLRFVAGLTHLEHESYEQYFNKELDLQCKRRPLFGTHYSRFRDNSEFTRTHYDDCLLSYTKFDIHLLHLLYESQNSKLCQLLSQNLKNQSICLYRRLTHFDILPLCYFLGNANISWNYLDLGELNGQAIQLLSNIQPVYQCIRLEIEVNLRDFDDINMKSVTKLFQLSFYQNLQECYIIVDISSEDLSDLTVVLLQLIKLQQLKILHFSIRVFLYEYPGSDQSKKVLPIDKIIVSELEECISTNTTLSELAITIIDKESSLSVEVNDITNSMIEGVTRNKLIETFSLTWRISSQQKNLFHVTKIENLLKDNHTLQCLKLDVDDQLLSSLNIVEVNTPLTALEVGDADKLMSLPQYFENLTHLSIHYPRTSFKYKADPFNLSCLSAQSQLLQLPQCLYSHSNLQELELLLDTAENVIELFTVLQSNTVVKCLRLKIDWRRNVFESMGPSLQKMLTLNQTIKYLAIDPGKGIIPSSYVSFLTTGLSCNNSLQRLSVPIPHESDKEMIRTFFSVISQKDNLTEFEVYFTTASFCSQQAPGHEYFVYHEQGLPLITELLKLHKTIKILELHIQDAYDYNEPKPEYKEIAQQFWQVVFSHSSLEHIGTIWSPVLEHTFKSQEKTLIEMHNQLRPTRPLPTIGLVYPKMHTWF